jgi:hypothetical protein
MDWQTAAVAIVMFCAVAYLARSGWRFLRGSRTGCGGGCGCSEKGASEGQAKSVIIPADHLRIRIPRKSP